MRAGDQVIRWSSTAAVITVAGIAAWTSYWHAVEVIQRYGAESPLSQHLVPITVDGLVAASSMVILYCARYDLTVPLLARCALGTGVVATLATNVLHGLSAGFLAACIAAWPAIALVVSYELMMWVVQASRRLSDMSGSEADGATAVSDIWNELSQIPEQDPRSLKEAASVSIGGSEGKTVKPLLTVPSAPASDLDLVINALREDPDVSGAELARRFGWDSRRGQRLRAKAVAQQGR